jgi:hypothetical protein
MTTGSQGHPRRVLKIQDWVLGADEPFTSRQISLDLNLLPVEVGNILKGIDGIERWKQLPTKEWLWRKVET